MNIHKVLLLVVFFAGCSESEPLVSRETPALEHYELEHVIESEARANGLSPSLVRAVILIESSGRSDVESHAGAVGLMQLMPDTARRVCNIPDRKLLKNPRLNIQCGAQVLGLHLRERQNVIKALVEYNGGIRCLKSRKCKESENYWQKVLNLAATV